MKLLSETAGSWYQVAGVLRNSGFVLIGLLLLALPAAGQITLGELSTTANGTISAGYTGDYGNQISSDHGLSVGGSGTFSGSYYNPNFVSFTVSPYLNQSRDNSAFQSISDASGVTASSNDFRRQPFSRIDQFRQGLQQRRQFLGSRSGQLHHARATARPSASAGQNWFRACPASRRTFRWEAVTIRSTVRTIPGPRIIIRSIFGRDTR